MVAERRFQGRDCSKAFIFICGIIVALCGSFLPAAEQSAASKPARYRVFSLKRISAEQGIKYLAEIGIGTVSQLPKTNTLLVTAGARELIKISAILRLVDAEGLFSIKVICPASEAENLPSNDKIAAEAGDILIGTFFSPPSGDAKAKAIIDVYEDVVMAVAPADRIEEIITAIEQLKGNDAQVTKPAPSASSGPALSESVLSLIEGAEGIEGIEGVEGVEGARRHKGPANSETEDANDEELFGKLLGSLAEAEKKAIKQARQVSRPNEPNAIVVNRKSLIVNQARSREPNLAAVGIGSAEDVAAEDVAKKPELEPKLEPASEQMAAEAKEPAIAAAEPSVAVRSYEPEPVDISDETLELNLPEKLNIIDLLDLAGKYLNLDYMYDDTKVKGTVALRLQGPIKVKDLYPLVESVLKFKDFVMTRKGNLVIIAPASEALKIDPAFQTDTSKLQYGDVIITRIFELKHIDPVSAKNLLVGMRLGTDINTAISETGTLIVTGYAFRMARIEELLRMIDKPGRPKHFRFRQLRYTMAKALVSKIKTLAEQMGAVSITIAAQPASTRQAKPFRGKSRITKQPAPPSKVARLAVYLDTDERTNRILMIGLAGQLAVVDELIDTLDVEQQDLRSLRLYEIQYVGAEEVKQKLKELGVMGGGQTTGGRSARSTRITKGAKAKAVTPATAGPAGEALVEEPQVVIIEATNSLLVNATAEQHIQIATIISYVDSEQEQAAIPYVVYPLENQDPEDLAGVLNKLVVETTTKQDKAAKITKTITKKIEEDIFIIPDPKTYSLIVYASKKNQQWIGSLIRQLDEYRPQVLLDVTLVSITKNEQFKFDLDLLTKYPTIPKVGSLGTISDLVTDPGRRLWEAKSKAGEGAKAFYADGHIQALLNSMHSKGYGRIMARPKLLVNDNETGIITTQRQTTIVSPKTDVIPVTGGGGTTSTSIATETYTSDITLEIQPHISKGDQLRLTIILNRTDFEGLGEEYSITVPDATGTLTGPAPPDLVTSNVSTVITVPNGRTIILGGLEQLNQSKGGTKVPLLGDIPIIGGLFKSTLNKDDQTRLYVFVKANILRPGEELTGESDLEKVSQKNRDAFEEFEREFQRLEDWSGVKTEPMDPLRILEAD